MHSDDSLKEIVPVNVNNAIQPAILACNACFSTKTQCTVTLLRNAHKDKHHYGHKSTYKASI